MPPSAPLPVRCSTAFADEQIVSALELKLHTLKQDVNEYWRLDATSRSPSPGVEIARCSLAARRQTREGGVNRPKPNMQWSDFLVVCC